MSSTYIKWYKNRETKLLMIGLDMSGKTTILKSLKLQANEKYDFDIGSNIEEIKHNGFNLYCWDVGGQERFPRWQLSYYQNVHGIIFVVDCSETRRIDEAQNILHRFLKREEFEKTIFLIFSNKNEQKKSLSTDQLAEKLKLKCNDDREYHIQEINALNGDGIYEGFDWLGEQINKKFV